MDAGFVDGGDERVATRQISVFAKESLSGHGTSRISLSVIGAISMRRAARAATGAIARGTPRSVPEFQPGRFRIQSAVSWNECISRSRSGSSRPTSCIAHAMQRSHWSRSDDAIGNGRCRARSRGWPKRSM
ncbi:hypothetical protein DM50_2614 [Burkholderia mallei]|nr:hypothetical protein DM50_2614 [Burkholderia mallei]